LASDSRFIDLKGKGKVYNVFTVRDSVSEYVLFITKKSEGSGYGVVYDLQNDKVHWGLTLTGETEQVMIPSSKEMIFYAINAINNSKGLEMSEYRFEGETLLPLNKMKSTGEGWHR